MTNKKELIEPIHASFDEVVEVVTKPAYGKGAPIPKATHSGDLELGGIACSVLEDGTRVLSHRGINTAFTGSHGGGVSGSDGAHKVPRFLASKAVQPFISKDLAARLNEPIEYQPQHGGRTAFGYEAKLLPEVCEVILDANRAGKLRNEQQGITAETILRGLARVGIIALVDEATGYQEDRARDALAKILTQYLSEEKQKWARTFPIDFYKEIYRLRGWNFDPWNTRRPGVIANWTDDFVYNRLAPTLTEELRAKNPISKAGRRKHKHHQWFNPEQGHPRLKEHIAGVIALLKAAGSWEGFKRSLDRAYPRFGDTIEMQLDEPD